VIGTLIFGATLLAAAACGKAIPASSPTPDAAPSTPWASRRILNLSMKLGGEVGEPQDLASVLAGETARRFPILKCKHARSASVEVRFKRLAVFTHGRVMLEAGAHIAIPDHVTVLRI
jgi:hypothetical protein